MTLPAALEPFRYFTQFITYKLVPRENGKTDKIPTDWQTGAAHDAHDPAIWTDYDTAYAHGGLVGYVFTDSDPFWFLDIDNCLVGANWSPLALSLCAMFAGAAIEVSQSGRGLHIFGTGTVPKHTTTCKAQGLEFYHTGRFAALGTGAVGNASTDCSTQVAALVAQYFQPGEHVGVEVGQWTDTPCEGWRGSEDDDDLIRRMRASKSAAGAFGSRATADQLWSADIAALAQAYPSGDNVRPFDASSADAALAQHLAFWTGKNCERMRTIMLRSMLYRDKWDRDDYLRRTILQACAKQGEVCQDKPKDVLTTGAMRDVAGEVYLGPADQKLFFTGCCYVADINRIIMPGGHAYGKEQFDAMFGGYAFSMDNENRKTIDSAWNCFTKSQAVKFAKAHSSSFRPDKPPGHIWKDGNDDRVNTYWPVTVESKRGNPGPFLKHLSLMLPDKQDQAIVLAYMAAIVQHKGVKFQWCPLLQGTRGNGKTMLTRCLTHAIGRAHTHSPKANEIAEKFNDWIEGKIFIGVEDIYVPGDRREVLEILKPMITSDWQEIRAMGCNKVTRFICANFMLNSNHKDALRTTRDNRGLAVFYTAQQTVEDLQRDGMAGDYFPNLYNWLKRDGYAIVTDYLQHYAIPDELNPAASCHRAPRTISTEESIRECMGTVEQEIQAAIMEDRIGFRGGWISSHYLMDLINRAGGARIARNKRRDIVLEMGYILHPGLNRGQTNNPVQPDGTKPTLFIHKGHPCEGLRGVAVAVAYSEAQTAPTCFLKVVGE